MLIDGSMVCRPWTSNPVLEGDENDNSPEESTGRDQQLKGSHMSLFRAVIWSIAVQAEKPSLTEHNQ